MRKVITSFNIAMIFVGVRSSGKRVLLHGAQYFSKGFSKIEGGVVRSIIFLLYIGQMEYQTTRPHTQFFQVFSEACIT